MNDPLPTTKVLRVLLIGTRHPDYFADNFAACLEDAGHQVRVVAPMKAPFTREGRLMARIRNELEQAPRLARRVQAHVLDAAEAFRPDITINLDYRLAYPIVKEIRSATQGAPVAFWFPDSPGNVRRETHLLAGYDAMFFKDSVQTKRYRRVFEVNAHFLPEACNPRWHRPIGPLAEPSDSPTVLIAGNMYTSRYVLLQHLVRRGITLRIHGSAWPRWLPEDPLLRAAYVGRPIVREEKAREFRGASLVLNNLASHEGDGSNARLFEAAGCGAVVLSEFRSRLPEQFRLGDEIATFHDAEELVREAYRLAALPQSRREAMGASASLRAHAEHDYGHRFGVITTVLGAG